MTHTSKQSHFSPLLLSVILVFGALLFIYNLDSLGLWVDEGWSVYVADSPQIDDAVELVAEDVHPPLYFVELYVWRQFTGESVFAYRYLTMLTVLLAGAVIYRAGQALFNRNAGLIAVNLYLLHDLVLVLGQEVRQYSLTQLLVVLTVWMYWRFIQQPTRNRTIMFVLAGTALMWTLYWGVFVLFALVIHAFLYKRQSGKVILPAFIVIGVLFVPWFPVLIEQVTTVSDGLGHALPNSRDGFEVLAFQYLGRPEIIFGALAIVGMFGTIKSWRPSSKTSLLALVVLVTLFLPIAINHFMAILSFRAMSITIPILVLLIAHTLTQFGQRERFIIVTIIILQSLFTASARHPVHLPLPDAAQYLIEHSDNDDVILVETWFDSYGLAYYLDAEDSTIDYVLSENEARYSDDADFVTSLADTLQFTDGVWVMAFSNRDDIRPLLMEQGFINTANHQIETDLNIPIELWRFDRSTDEILTNFGDVFTLQSAQTRVGEGEITVNLLWSSLIQPEDNYTISVFLLNGDGALVTQHDGYPFDNFSPTSTWNAEQPYFDSHLLVTENLPSGTYQLGIKIYRQADDGAITVLQIADCDVNCEFALVDAVELP